MYSQPSKFEPLLVYGYVRLSQEEERSGESSSIKNQRTMIEGYCREHGYTLLEIFSDDGYTGANFQRPGFLSMIKKIESRRANTVITKDLSRLGRDMRESSYYAETWFPEHGIRYMAISDQFDSSGENMMAPLQFAMNEMYLRDGSRKTKEVLNRKKKDGEYAACPPYGYRKSELDKSKLTPDPNTAPIVQRIFKLAASGESAHRIAVLLTEEGVIPPLKYRALYRDDFGPRGLSHVADDWNHTTVKRILRNKTYLGHTLLRRTKKVSVKSKKKMPLPEEEWFVTHSTHEALVSQDDFNEAQRWIGRNTREYRKHPQVRKSIFSGIAVCSKCGSAACSSGTVYRGEREKYWYLSCNSITKKGAHRCEGVRIKYVDLLEVVRQELNSLITMTDAEIEEMTRRAIRRVEEHRNVENGQAQIEQANTRLMQITQMIGKLYQDNVSGKIDDDTLDQLVMNLERESRGLKASLTALSEVKETADIVRAGYERFFAQAQAYSNIETLDRETVMTFIDRIEIGEKILPPGLTIAGPKTPYRQTVRIFYKFIGEMAEDPEIDIVRAAAG